MNRGADETPTWNDADHPRPQPPAPPTKPFHAIRFNPPSQSTLSLSLSLSKDEDENLPPQSLTSVSVSVSIMPSYTLPTLTTHNFSQRYPGCFQPAYALRRLTPQHTEMLARSPPCTHAQEPQSTMLATAVK